MAESTQRDAIRAMDATYELREADDGGPPTLFGHFAVFNRWSVIDSIFETRNGGRFLERIAPGAFKKTFAEQRDRIKVLFQHGRDPQLDDKPLGKIEELREDDTGAYYEVRLYQGIPDLVMEGLRDRAYGASFRFKMMREEWNDRPSRSEHNPDALPERTLRELAVPEFGPVTFPAYAEATAGVRSLTDYFIFEHMQRNPEQIRALLSFVPPSDEGNAPSDTDAGTSTSGQERRASRDYLTTEKEVAWQL